MLYTLIAKRLDAFERDLGESMDYLKHMARASLRSFLDFAFRSPTAWKRRHLAREPYHVARLVAVRSEDCGPCVQTAVNLALGDGVRPGVLRAVVAGRPEALDADLADVYAFALAVAENTGDEDRYRDVLRERYGDKGLVEMALAISSARMYPVLKRTLGYAKSCSSVRVEVGSR
jgi:alkylhydroperoxidase family enzyme